MYTIKPTTKFQKDLKRIEKCAYTIDLPMEVIKKLAVGKTIDETYLDHPLKGNYIGCRECHITPDWLLDIQEISNDTLILYLMRTDTHSDTEG